MLEANDMKILRKLVFKAKIELEAKKSEVSS